MGNSIELNSWLVQSERSMNFRCPPGLDVTQEEYLEALKETAQELELPLELETVPVSWVDARLNQVRIQAKLNSEERFGLLTGLDYIGRVAFVEQKTYLDPPNIPELAKADYTFPAILIGGGVVIGIFLMALQEIATVCLGFLVLFGGVGMGITTLLNAARQPKAKQEKAIDKWVGDVIDLARRAEISNELNRMAQALDEAVKLAVDKLFTQQGAKMEADEKSRKTASDIQKALEDRRKDFF